MEPKNNTPTPTPQQQPVPVMGQAKKSPVQMLVVIGLVVLVAIVAIIMWAHGSKKTPTPSSSTSAVSNLPAAKVSISATDGFSPATVKIKKGQSVSWTNQDSKPHQIATDPYPAENGLPGFVEESPLLAGDSYTFNFSKTGTYTYHDHLNPLTLKGTVIVE